MSDNLVQRALERLRRATELDGAGDIEHAVDEYDAGVVLLARAMAVEKDPNKRATLSTKCSEYADHADDLRKTLEEKKPAPAQPSAESSSSQSSSAAKSEAQPKPAEPAMSAAEREQADLEARLNALKSTPLKRAGPPPVHQQQNMYSGDAFGGYGNGSMSVDDILRMSSQPRSEDEQADEILRRALAEVQAEEAARRQYYQQYYPPQQPPYQSPYPPGQPPMYPPDQYPPPQQQYPYPPGQPAMYPPDQAPQQPPQPAGQAHPPVQQQPAQSGPNPEDDGWDELEAKAEEEYGEYDDEDIRAMIAESREELEKAMRAEDPDFNWDDYDLPDDFRADAEALKRERERTRREQDRYLDDEKEGARRERFKANAQKKIDAFKSYIAKYKTKKP